jgi:hypothetical protein
MNKDRGSSPFHAWQRGEEVIIIMKRINAEFVTRVGVQWVRRIIHSLHGSSTVRLDDASSDPRNLSPRITAALRHAPRSKDQSMPGQKRPRPVTGQQQITATGQSKRPRLRRRSINGSLPPRETRPSVLLDGSFTSGCEEDSAMMPIRRTRRSWSDRAGRRSVPVRVTWPGLDGAFG